MKKTILIILILLGFTGFAQTQSLKDHYKKIDELLEIRGIGESLTAINLLQSKCAADSGKARYWIRLANASLFAFRRSDAKKYINKSIKVEPKNAEAYYQKARMVFDLSRNVVECRKLMDKAVQYDSKNSLYFFYRGIYLQENRELAEAGKDYEKAISLGHKNQGMFRNYALLLGQLNQPEKALKYINKAIDMYPSAANYKSRADIHFFSVNPDKACEDYRRAVNGGYNQSLEKYRLLMDNKHLNKYRLTAGVLANLKLFKQAIKAYSKAIAATKDTASNYLNRGFCYFSLKEYKKAEKDYLKSLSYPSQHDKANKIQLLNNLSVLYFKQGKYKKSIAYSKETFKVDSKNARAYVNIGFALNLLGKPDEAIKNFEQALTINPQNFRAFGHRAVSHLLLDNPTQALKDARQSLAIQPQFDNAWVAMGHAKRLLKMKGYCNDYEKAASFGNPEAYKAMKLYCSK